jgi:DNA-binding NtrC family response regulator
MGYDSLTVLVVDDEPAMRLVLEARLRSWGYETLLAADGDEAERLVKEAHPAIVVSDVVMPGRSGLEMIQTLKTGDAGRPVILITAQGTIDMAVEAMKQGAQDFLTKPLDHAKLRAVLDAAREEIELRRASQKLEAHAEKQPGTGTAGSKPASVGSVSKGKRCGEGGAPERLECGAI